MTELSDRERLQLIANEWRQDGLYPTRGNFEWLFELAWQYLDLADETEPTN